MNKKLFSTIICLSTLVSYAQQTHNGKVVGSFDYGNKDVTTIYDEVTGCERRTTPHKKNLFTPNENVEIIFDDRQLAEVTKPQMIEKVYTRKDCNEVVNPYDTYSQSLKPYYDQLNQVVALSDSISKDSLTALIINIPNSSQYPVINSSPFTNKEKTYLNNVVEQLNLGTYRSNRVLNSVVPIEEDILNDNTLSSEERERLLNSISQLKYNLHFLGGVTNEPAGMSVASFEHWLDRCVSDALSDIFNDGNWIDQSVFIAGTPYTTIALVSSCAWDVSVGNYP